MSHTFVYTIQQATVASMVPIIPQIWSELGNVSSLLFDLSSGSSQLQKEAI